MKKIILLLSINILFYCGVSQEKHNNLTKQNKNLSYNNFKRQGHSSQINYHSKSKEIEKDFKLWAKENAKQLPMDQKSDNTAFSPIGKAICNAQFVALSESAHNTREFLKMNARIVQYLVEEKGFTRLVAETGFPESKKVNDYILGADIKKKEWTNGLNPMYSRWEEFNTMIEWLKLHNAKVSDDKKVKFYGIDIAGGYHDLMPAFNIIRTYLKKVDLSYAKKMSKKILPLLDILKSDKPRQARNRYIRNLSLKQKYAFEMYVNLIINRLSDHKKAYIKKSNLQEFEFVRQSSIALFQALNYYFNTANLKNTDYNKTVGVNGREIAMFQNFSWVYKQDTKAKIIIINHNVHSKTKSGYLDDFWKFFTPFGAFVRQHFGDRYYAIGAAYDHGKYWVNWTKNKKRIIMNSVHSDEGKIDYVFKSIGIPYFFVDFKSIPDNRLAYKWLSMSIIAREHDEPMPITPNEFDGYIFYNTISIPTEYIK